MNRLAILLVLLLGTVLTVRGAGDPAAAGMDPTTVAAITARMKQFVDNDQIGGVVTLVQRKGIVAQFEAFGWQDKEARKPMRADSIFQIMSMSKPIAGVAVMMMERSGSTILSSNTCPNFAGNG